ncbi:MAG: hypothetical protein E3J87_07960 [Candidatus Cloacimonadota bacterium]|nr:MAG: hypothetical protein E3J87_07960 [Candidatus Cloacimonadota bacterium]
MNLQFPIFRDKGCKYICWCFPIKLKKKEWERIQNKADWKRNSKEIQIKESFTKKSKNSSYFVKLNLKKTRTKYEYFCIFRIELGKRQKKTISDIEKVFDIISTVYRKKTLCAVCALNEFSLKKTRPIIEIPFAFPGVKRKATSLGKGWVTGIKLEFEESETGLEKANITVDKKNNKMLIGIRSFNQFVVGQKMPKEVFKYVRFVNGLFIEEVKR